MKKQERTLRGAFFLLYNEKKPGVARHAQEKLKGRG